MESWNCKFPCKSLWAMVSLPLLINSSNLVKAISIGAYPSFLFAKNCSSLWQLDIFRMRRLVETLNSTDDRSIDFYLSHLYTINFSRQKLLTSLVSLSWTMFSIIRFGNFKHLELSKLFSHNNWKNMMEGITSINFYFIQFAKRIWSLWIVPYWPLTFHAIDK